MTHSNDPTSIELAALQREGFAVDPAPPPPGRYWTPDDDGLGSPGHTLLRMREAALSRD